MTYNMRRILQALALGLIMLIISKNFLYFPGFLRSMISGHPPISSETPPGRDFLPLSPFLEDVPIAGFYSDRYGADFWSADTALSSRLYQQAQYALAPTLLDVENCFKHPFVIFVCAQSGCSDRIMRTQGLTSVVNIDNRIILTRKIKAAP